MTENLAISDGNVFPRIIEERKKKIAKLTHGQFFLSSCFNKHQDSKSSAIFFGLAVISYTLSRDNKRVTLLAADTIVSTSKVQEVI